MKNCNPCQLATVCVPWSESGEFLEPVFRRQVRLLRAAGLENLYIFGTAGEGYALTDPVFKQIATVFFDAMRGGSGLCQLGVIAFSVAQVRERIETGLELGFTQFQISLPSWGHLNDAELDRFFADILGAYPEAAFLHYNTSRGGRVLSGVELARVKAEHPNLVATKSGGHTVASLLALFEKAPGVQHFVTELDYATACLLGLDPGLLVSVSAVNPRRSLEFFRAGKNGQLDELRTMLTELNAIREKIIALVTQTGGHMDGAFDKVYARLLDPDFPVGLLSPYQGADEDVCETFARWLETTLPAWAGAE